MKLPFFSRLFKRRVRLFTEYRHAPWDSSRDGGALSEFLKTDTGRRLLQVLSSKGAYQNMMACTEIKKDRSHACGVANGYEQARQDLLFLALVSEETEQMTDPSDEEIDAQIKEMTNY